MGAGRWVHGLQEPPGLGRGCAEKGPWLGERAGHKVERPQGLRRGEQLRVLGSHSGENLRSPHSIGKSMQSASPSSRWPWLRAGWISVDAGGHRCRRTMWTGSRRPSAGSLASLSRKRGSTRGKGRGQGGITAPEVVSDCGWGQVSADGAECSWEGLAYAYRNWNPKL